MRILFVHAYPATFAQTDLNILQAEHVVRELYVQRDSLLDLLAGLVQAMAGVRWADMVFAMFGGYHALVPFLLGRLLGRSCLVVVSGHDVASVPEIGFGNMRPGLRRYVGRLVFFLAHRLLAVSHFSALEAERNAGVPSEKIQVVHHGIDLPALNDQDDLPSERQGIITVAYIKQDNVRIKGLMTFIEAARQLPGVPFRIIGPAVDGSADYMRSIAPPNVSLPGASYGASLVQAMRKAKVYVQISAYESFGMALAEAMWCGCVPVVTARAAIPEIVGDTGFYVPYGDVDATVEAIRRALATGPQASRRCRQRIVEKFPLEKRRKELLKIVRGFSSG